MSSIPAPLVTNVTAQSMIQVAPKPLAGAKQQGPQSQIAWSALKDLASLPQSSPTLKTGTYVHANPTNAKISNCIINIIKKRDILNSF